MALGYKAGMIIQEASYDLSDPTIDSQMLALKNSSADIFFIAATPKFSAQAIRKGHDLNWKPMRIVVTAANQLKSVLKPAGLEASTGLLSSAWIMAGGDPAWQSLPAMQEFNAFMAKWVENASPEDASATYAYSTAQMLAEVLRRCGDELTRENLMKQATSIKDYQLPLFVPGVKVNISETSRTGWRQGQMERFDGTNWVFFDSIVTIPEQAMTTAN